MSTSIHIEHIFKETRLKMEAKITELEAALTTLNAELDAFWNEPPEVKYVDGRMNDYYAQSITRAQIASRAALNKEQS